MPLVVRQLNLTRYGIVYESMKAFTRNRDKDTDDELWLTEHEPVYTQGHAGKREHLLGPVEIPLVQSNRGGQITYHGPGQIVAYLLFDIGRMHLSVREFVNKIELSMIRTLKYFGIESEHRKEAPGVYVGEKKIGSLGLRISRGLSYHGLSLNVNGDLQPFEKIHPCGIDGLKITSMADYGVFEILEVSEILKEWISREFGFTGLFHRQDNWGL